jgi:dolichol-phosphate mannosyltransferase
MEGIRFSIIVPLFNEEAVIEACHKRLFAVINSLGESWEIIYVNDGSRDRTAQLARRLCEADTRVKLISFSRNFGHQAAITAGMDHAAGDAVVIIDADLQDPPETIADLLAKWREGFEVVYAVRKSREGETWLKKFLAASFYRTFHRLAKVNVPMDAGDFRLVDRKVVDALKEVRELHRFMRGLTCWVGFRQGAVYYDRAARLAGETKYPVWKSLRLAFDAITSFSAAPLRWMTVTGALISLAGFIHGLMIVAGRIFHPERYAPGWATVVALILFLTGVQLLCLGLVGQYISRIFEESKRRPLYFVRTDSTQTRSLNG